jgi:hypothetical protein
MPTDTRISPIEWDVLSTEAIAHYVRLRCPSRPRRICTSDNGATELRLSARLIDMSSFQRGIDQHELDG